ncbi:Uma2 family endonuclease, partial [Candidatus Poribacteria bacterium]|nr:Uma2 family endonuclease [Candidatus Poribacteria bacterium]
MNATPRTLEEFMAHDYGSYEYVKGELVPMSMPTMVHGEISSNIDVLLSVYVRQHQLGRVYVS